MTVEQLLLGVSVLGGLTGFAALLDVYMRRNKTKAEEKKLGIDSDISMSQEARELYKLVRAEAQEVKAQALYCQAKVDALEDHIEVLRSVMRRHALKPPPFQFPGFVAWKEGSRL